MKEGKCLIQQDLFLPDEIDLDRQIDAKTGVEYFGKAKRQENGKYVVLAKVSGCLCVVEVNVGY